MQASRKSFELSLASAYFVHFLSTSPAISRNRFGQVPGPTVPPSPAVVVKSPAPFQARLGMQRSDRSDWMEENPPQNVPYGFGYRLRPGHGFRPPQVLLFRLRSLRHFFCLKIHVVFQVSHSKYPYPISLYR